MSTDGRDAKMQAKTPRVWVRRTNKVLRRTGYTLIALFAGVWIFTIAVRYPNPIMSYKLGFATASETVDLQASRPIKATT